MQEQIKWLEDHIAELEAKCAPQKPELVNGKWIVPSTPLTTEEQNKLEVYRARLAKLKEDLPSEPAPTEAEPTPAVESAESEPTPEPEPAETAATEAEEQEELDKSVLAVARETPKLTPKGIAQRLGKGIVAVQQSIARLHQAGKIAIQTQKAAVATAKAEKAKDKADKAVAKAEEEQTKLEELVPPEEEE